MIPTRAHTAIQRAGHAAAFHGYPEGCDLIERFILMKYSKTSTRRSYANALQSFVRLAMGYPEEAGRVTLTPEGARTIKTPHVEAFLEDMTKNKYAPATIKHRRAVLMKFFRHLVAAEVIERNPADPEIIRAAPSVSEKESIVWLTRDQANALVKAAGETSSPARDRAIIMMLVGCALRRSELVAVDVEHITEKGAYTYLKIPEAKGGAGSVRIEPHILEAIETLKVEEGITSGALFRSAHRNPAYRGKRLFHTGLYRIVQRISARAGNTINPHVLRHTACTLAIISGAKLPHTQHFMRHKSPNTTIGYTHLIDDHENAASGFVNVTG